MAEPCPKHCDHIVGHVAGPVHGPFMPPGDRPFDLSAFRCCHCGRYNSYGRDLSIEEIIFDVDAGCDPRSPLQNIAPMATREKA